MQILKKWQIRAKIMTNGFDENMSSEKNCKIQISTENLVSSAVSASRQAGLRRKLTRGRNINTKKFLLFTETLLSHSEGPEMTRAASATHRNRHAPSARDSRLISTADFSKGQCLTPTPLPHTLLGFIYLLQQIIKTNNRSFHISQNI